MVDFAVIFSPEALCFREAFPLQGCLLLCIPLFLRFKMSWCIAMLSIQIKTSLFSVRSHLYIVIHWWRQPAVVDSTLKSWFIGWLSCFTHLRNIMVSSWHETSLVEIHLSKKASRVEGKILSKGVSPLQFLTPMLAPSSRRAATWWCKKECRY